MTDHTGDFGLERQTVWLNAASEGPIPKVAAESLREAASWKLAVHLLTLAKFQHVPRELKNSLARLIQVNSDDIILGNSATYGIHLLANGLPLTTGDEVLLMRNDFPSDILPWLHLSKVGVKVHQLKPNAEVLTIDEIKAAINSKTRVVCLPLVHTFSGWSLDIVSIGELCRRKNITFAVNVSQAAGAFEFNASQWPVDAVIGAGYKWLLGPYGTGFCWIKPTLREQLTYPQAYWVALMDARELSSEGEITLREDHSARRYDVFATANFFNFVPWRASIDYLLGKGLANVGRHNRTLIDHLVDRLDAKYFDWISPTARAQRTNIAVFSHKDRSHNKGIFEYLNALKIFTALWKGKLRVAPHIYNTVADMDRLLDALGAYCRQREHRYGS